MMNTNDVISQLKSLKEVEPNENWVVSVREEILTNAPYNDVATGNVYSTKPSRLDNISYILESITKKYRYMPSFASMSIILLVGSFFTVTAAKTSLPGDPLYSLKLANENIVLAMANEDDKPAVEVEFAGKRLEELSQISKNASDSDQQTKVEQLVKTFEEKIVSANEKMTKISQTSEKKKVAQVAKQINNQTEKYTELLAKTNENLPSVVKDKVTEQIASAMNTTEKANMDSLLILAETNQQIDEKEISDKELTDIIIKKVEEINTYTPSDKTENKAIEGKTDGLVNDGADKSNNDVAASSDTKAETKTQPKDEKSAIMDSITENLNNNNLIDAVKGVAAAQKLDSDQNNAAGGTTNDIPDDTQNPVEADPNDDKTDETAGSGDSNGKIDNIVTPVPAE